VILRPLPVAEANSILIMSNEYPKPGPLVATTLPRATISTGFGKCRFESQAMFPARATKPLS